MATGTAGDTGQRYHQNLVHYLVKNVTYLTLNGLGTAAGTTNATVKIGDLPPRAMVVAGGVWVVTGFDDTNGDDLDVGVSGSDDDLFHSAMDLNTADVYTAFDDLASANDYSTTARIVTCNFTTVPSGNGTAGEA